MKRLILAVMCCSLWACAGGEHDELRQWMEESSKGMRGSIPKLPEVQPYEPVPYGVDALLPPFNANKIEPESKSRRGSGKGSIYQPDFDARDMRNSILEKYPLESLKMIGYLNVNKRPMAVIQVEDKVKQVKAGEYIGLDFGMVTKITEQEVELRELVEDAAGDWSERKSTLHLQGKEGSKK